MGIEKLKFTGDGTYWLRANGKNMNPDFKISGCRKVVEVGDIYYWHTEEDIAERIKNLKDINFECLYLTNKEMENLTDFQLTKMIVEFING